MQGEKLQDQTILKLQGLGISFGGLKALSGIDMEVGRRELVGVIGPNGAGKSTLFNLVTCIYPPGEGTFHFKGRLVHRLKPYEIARYGIARTFQNIRLFEGMTVKEHVKIGLQQKAPYSVLDTLARSDRARKIENEIEQEAGQLLKNFGLSAQASQFATHLSYGKQRRLEIVRALATKPDLLLLDEPAAGLNSSETRDLSSLVRRLRDELDLTIIVIEHDMRFIMGLCEKIMVLDSGKKIAEGKPEEVQNNPDVIRAYLGEENKGKSSVSASSSRRGDLDKGIKKEKLLSVSDLSVSYGSILALKKCSLEVHEGEIVTLIGANGAGKSTMLKAVSGLIDIQRGKVQFVGRNITGMPAHKITHFRMAHVPEGRGIFANLTVAENLELGAFLEKSKKEKRKRFEHVLELFPQLADRLGQSGGTLSGGEQQMLAIGRAMMRRPKLLLLDEPSLGLAPQLVNMIFHLIQEINREGVSILLIEQNANMALKIAHRGYVIETGSIVSSGNSQQLENDPVIREAYLGH